MGRRWSGILVVEGVQTGDGRVIAADALYWENLPIPLEWAPSNQGSHDDYVVVGAIETITRSGGNIEATGFIDEEGPHGTEVLRLMTMDPPLASGVSIVMDDMAVEFIDNTDGTEEDVPILIASAGTVLRFGALSFAAAAGEPDPGDEAEVLFTDSQDAVLMRVTRARLRAATLVDVGAFIDAVITLDDTETPAEEPIAASAARADWFREGEPPMTSDLYVEQTDDVWAVPLTIDDDGHVFGHVAYWGQCHVGFNDRCVSPPRSTDDYRLYHTGTVALDDGTTIATGVLSVSADHPDRRMFHADAADNYAHTGLAWADVRASNGEHGIWVTGRVRPGLTDDQLDVLRASAPSGDWRPVPGANGLQMIAVLSVNHPGFPIAREALAASGFHPAAGRVEVDYDAGQVVRMAGVNMVRQCRNCAGTRLLSARPDRTVIDALLRIQRTLDVLDTRTKHLRPAAKAALLETIRR